jgi:hypothetical protein
VYAYELLIESQKMYFLEKLLLCWLTTHLLLGWETNIWMV